MAGHSKWANIKHRKDAQDAKRGKLFSKLSKEITTAALSNPNFLTNSALRIAISKAKSHSMPKKNIENAIKNASKDNKNSNFKEISYAANVLGISFLIICLTDNVNRAYSQIHHLISKADGSISNSNSISYIFNRKGIIEVNAINKNEEDEEELMMFCLEAGAEDFQKKENSFFIYTSPQLFSIVKEKLEYQGILEFKTAEVQYIPIQKVKLPKEKVEKILNFVDKLKDIHDIQNVYHNFDNIE